MSDQVAEGVHIERRHWIYRHAVPVRITHWINVVCLTLLLMSGLQIFNAHPALYWGAQSHFDTPLLEMKANPADEAKGVTRVFGREFDTTGWLGVSRGTDGSATERGFPAWITVPSDAALATGRRWHFFFAWLLVLNGLVYLIYGALSRHFQRDLAPSRRDWRHIGRSIVDHALLRFPKGEEAKHYNVLQKLSYLAIIFVVLPVMILAGLAMSPGMDAAFPQLVTILGGRQSARTIHFILAWTIVLFVVVHVLMVALSGVWNNIRSMITGRYDIDAKSKDHETKPAT